MAAYELAVLLRNEKDLEKVRKLLKDTGATIEKESTKGQLDLAYPIKKETKAFYYFLDITIDGSAIAGFKQKMNFDETFLRYLLLKKN